MIFSCARNSTGGVNLETFSHRGFGRARHAYAARALGAAADLVSSLERGGWVFGISCGQFAAIDTLQAVLDRIGPARVDVWTYAPGRYEVERLGALLDEARITALRLVVDQSSLQLRERELFLRLRDRFGADCLRVVKAHAKLMSFATADGWRVVIDGSANLAKNLRFEHINIRDDGGVHDLVTAATDDLFARMPAPPIEGVGYREASQPVRDLLDDPAEARSPAQPAWAPAARTWW